MQNKFIRRVRLLFDPKIVRILLGLRNSGYLYDMGWINSLKEVSSIDKNEQPIPWITYPFTDFIATRLNADLEVFEFGCGNSTFYFSKRVKKVVSVEDNMEWHDKITKRLPSNVTIKYVSSNEDGYYKAALNCNQKFDIIIVDGRKRVNCVMNSLDALSNQGVLILDDSEREEYKSGIDFMAEKGYKKIDFWGMAPGVTYRKATTVFYKAENCLGI